MPVDFIMGLCLNGFDLASLKNLLILLICCRLLSQRCFMGNLLTLSYWFNLNPGPFLGNYSRVIYGVALFLLLLSLLSWFPIKKNDKDKLLQRFWQKVQSFTATIGVVVLILVFLRQQRVSFLAMPFWMLVLFTVAIVWIYFIFRYATKKIPRIRKEQAEREAKEKYF